MKSLLLVYENAAAEPMDALDGRTPLQVARCPHATRLAGEGLCGLLSRLPAGEGPRAEALLAALLGVPRGDAWRLSRGALEAEAVGADWLTFNYAYRADLVTLDQGIMRDAHLARLTPAETERLVASLQAELDALNVRIKPVRAGHAVVMMQQDDVRQETGFAPWLVAENDEAPRLEGKRARLAREVMEAAARVLARQTINDVRVDLGENPVTDLWLWAGGTPVELLEKFGGRNLRGAMLTQSAMARGLGLRMGMTVEPLAEPWLTAEATPAVTGETLTRLWQEHDLVVVYVEAPATLLEGPAKDRVHLLERLDLLVTGPLLEAVKKIKHRRMVLATVPTAAGPGSSRDELELPVVVWGAHVNPDAAARWDEVACAAGELSDVDATDVFGRLVGG
jgi:2,3-bisphosphoglycerate-independent phosphoglycerate mutase